MSGASQDANLKQERSRIILGTSSWMVCSIGMLVFNKMAVQVVPLPCFLVAIQMAFSVVVMAVCFWKSIRIGSMKDVARWCIVVPFFLGMLLTSLFALKHAPMSLVVTFRALSPLFSLLIERVFFSKPPDVNLASLWPLVVIILGAALYARDVPRSSEGLTGIGWVFANTFFALGDRLLQRLFLSGDESPVDISTHGVTLLNNLLGMFPLLFVASYTGEFDHISAALAHVDSLGWFYIIASCVVGVGISFTGILVQGMISATSFLVLINGNKFVIILLEVTIMHHADKSLTYRQLLGAFCAIIGSCFWGCRGKDIGTACEEFAQTVGIRTIAEAQSKKNEYSGKKADPYGSVGGSKIAHP